MTYIKKQSEKEESIKIISNNIQIKQTNKNNNKQKTKQFRLSK